MILLNNIFSSLQGEGPFQGYPTLFVRLHGCNLNCVWCDTPEAKNGDAPQTIGISELKQKMAEYRVSHLCITGGEPLLQQSALIELLREVEDDYMTVSIETNGTLPIATMVQETKALFSVDLKPPSSGHDSFEQTIYDTIAQRGWLKIVVSDDDDLQWVERQFAHLASLKCEIFISPVSQKDGDWYRTVAEWTVKHGAKLPMRMQLQLHKQIGVL